VNLCCERLLLHETTSYLHIPWNSRNKVEGMYGISHLVNLCCKRLLYETTSYLHIPWNSRNKPRWQELSAFFNWICGCHFGRWCKKRWRRFGCINNVFAINFPLFSHGFPPFPPCWRIKTFPLVLCYSLSHTVFYGYPTGVYVAAVFVNFFLWTSWYWCNNYWKLFNMSQPLWFSW